MSNVNKLSANSDLYAQIEQVPMGESERVRALATLRTADAFVDGVVGVSNSIKRLFTASASSENELSANSDIYAQIEQVPMDESERVRALATLRTADAFVDGIVWVSNGIKRLFTASASNEHKLAA